jgi:cytochrome c6
MAHFALVLLLSQAALPSPAPVPRPAARANVTPAAETWRNRCIICHGPDGKGNTPHGREYKVPDFTDPAWQKGITDERILQAITNGNPSRGMMAFGSKLPAEEIAAMVPYLRAFGHTRKERDAR